MRKPQKLELIRATGIIAIIRAQSSGQLVDAAEAIFKGGVRVIEVTMTTPNALGVIAEASAKFGDQILFGAGSVLDVETARMAILAGAGFIVAPSLKIPVIELCNRYSIPAMPGCYTSTEIVAAWEAGADMVKLFPASVGGPQLVRALLAPLPQVEIVPVGGVELTNAAEFIQCGATALGVGSSLINQKLLDAGDMTELTRRAAAFVSEVKKGRERK